MRIEKMSVEKVVLLMGSPSDEGQARKIGETAEAFGVKCEYRIASAHKTPAKLLQVLEELEKEAGKGAKIVLVGVVGMSNALSGVLAAQTVLPTITCPVYSAEDLMSSIRMPSDVPHSLVLSPKNAGLAAVRILALSNPALRKKLLEYKGKMMKRIEDADAELQGKGKKKSALR